MAASDLIPDLQDAVAGFQTTVAGKQTTIDGKKASGETAASNAHDSKDSTVALKDVVKRTLDSAYADARSAVANTSSQDLDAVADTKSDTAIDVIVYDTSKDSDGGAWRYRTRHTSWYNEPLNTTTRGSRREFPSVAIVVVENSLVTIYDADDPALPMWMVFEAGSQGQPDGTHWKFIISGGLSSGAMFNGMLVVGRYSLNVCDFVGDRMEYIGPSAGGSGPYDNAAVDKRNAFNLIAGGRKWLDINGHSLESSNLNDVAITTLPDAPIDPVTGLPRPTIAAVAGNGVSIIKDDQTIVDITGKTARKVALDAKNKLVLANFDVNYSPADHFNIYAIPSADHGYTANRIHYYHGNMREPQIGKTLSANGGFPHGFIVKDKHIYGAQNSNPGPCLTILTREAQTSDQMSCLIDKDRTTGWLPGLVKMATLADTGTDSIGLDNTNLSQTTSGTYGYNATFSLSSAPTAGRMYLVEYTITASSYTGDLYLPPPNGPFDYKIVSKAVGSHSYLVKAQDADTTFMALGGASGQTGTITFSSISVKEAEEHVDNGTFDTNANGWTDRSGLTSTANNGAVELRYNNTTNYGEFYQVLTLEVGKPYLVSVDVISLSSAATTEAIGIGHNAMAIGNENRTSLAGGGTKSFVYVPTSATTYLAIKLESGDITNTSPLIVDNISVKIAEPDRSTYASGLVIKGNITKTPVATGAELVSYGPFTNNNHLEQPHNPHLDFGTGDFSIICWVKASGNGFYFCKGEPSVSNKLYLRQLNGVLTASAGGGTISGGKIPDGVWSQVVLQRRSGIVTIWANGELQTSSTSTGDLTDSSHVFRIGIKTADIANAFAGQLSLLRISVASMTGNQIRKIYNDEKFLFQENAACTLYENSTIDALAYDDSTNLLYAGTNNGTSVFQGLRRVDNTTTSAREAVSVSNGLLVEE